MFENACHEVSVHQKNGDIIHRMVEMMSGLLEKDAILGIIYGK